MEYGERPSSSMTNAELKQEVDYLIEQTRKDRLERGLPEKQPADFVSLAMAWTMYERCDPLFKFAIRYAQLCDQANEILDRKSTRLNSSHVANSYAVFCVK